MTNLTFFELSEMFSALSGEVRIKLLKVINDKNLNCKDPQNCDLSDRCCDVSELSKEMNLPISTISYHLKELRRAGLIQTMRKQKHVYCSINLETMEKLAQFFKTFNQTCMK